jgi:hypothetical protein
MANGDAAAAAGMDVVPGTAKVRLGYDEINKTRDYVAQRANRSYLGITVASTAPASPILNHLWFKPL